jgi:hypothetical protein
MRRRKFIGILGGMALAWPRGVMAQGAAKRPLIAVLVAGSSESASRWLSGFPHGLHAVSRRHPTA